MTAEEIEAMLAPTVERMGFEISDLEVRLGRRNGLLRLYIDAPQGVGLEDCARVSDQVSGLLDVEDPLPGEYVLEVSSPGLDRRLRKPEHFERFVGSEVKVVLRAPQEGRRRFRGRLAGLDGGVATVEVDGREWRLPLADIESARLVPAL